jgi:DNA-binding MarR family transcriptional regulator
MQKRYLRRTQRGRPWALEEQELLRLWRDFRKLGKKPGQLAKKYGLHRTTVFRTIRRLECLHSEFELEGLLKGQPGLFEDSPG